MTPRFARLVAATVLAAAALPGAAFMAAPASAAVCAAGSGVSVVVDFRELGGGVQSACDPDGATKSAAALMTDNGFPLTYVQRQPGFVCRVSGKPETDPCVNTPPSTAYWGLYWSNGTSGAWVYSSSGAGSLKVPAGGSVGFAWQGASTGGPGVAPPASGESPSPSPSPTPTNPASPTPTGPSSPAPTSGTTPTKSPTKSPTSNPATNPTTNPTRSPTSGSTPGVGGADQSGSPTSGASASASAATDSASPTNGSSSAAATEATGAEGGASAATDTIEPTDATPDSADSTSSAASTEATEPGSGSVPLPLVLLVMGLVGAAVAGTVVLRSRRTP